MVRESPSVYIDIYSWKKKKWSYRTGIIFKPNYLTHTLDTTTYYYSRSEMTRAQEQRRNSRHPKPGSCSDTVIHHAMDTPFYCRSYPLNKKKKKKKKKKKQQQKKKQKQKQQHTQTAYSKPDIKVDYQSEKPVHPEQIGGKSYTAKIMVAIITNALIKKTNNETSGVVILNITLSIFFLPYFSDTVIGNLENIWWTGKDK